MIWEINIPFKGISSIHLKLIKIFTENNQFFKTCYFRFYWETKSLIKRNRQIQSYKNKSGDSQRWAISNGGRMSNRMKAKDNMKMMMFQMIYRLELIWKWNSLNNKNQILFISPITKTNWIFFILQSRRIHTIQLAILTTTIVLLCHCLLF